jgi:hypothetical protein
MIMFSQEQLLEARFPFGIPDYVRETIDAQAGLKRQYNIGYRIGWKSFVAGKSEDTMLTESQRAGYQDAANKRDDLHAQLAPLSEAMAWLRGSVEV